MINLGALAGLHKRQHELHGRCLRSDRCQQEGHRVADVTFGQGVGGTGACMNSIRWFFQTAAAVWVPWSMSCGRIWK
jgi:hypothetical protein